jgi:hypothetical protein
MSGILPKRHPNSSSLATYVQMDRNIEVSDGLYLELTSCCSHEVSMSSVFSLCGRREAGVISDTTYWKGTRG